MFGIGMASRPDPPEAPEPDSGVDAVRTRTGDGR